MFVYLAQKRNQAMKIRYSPLAWLPVMVVKAYQLVLSPWLPKSCRFTPSCSQYMLEALAKYGAFKGLAKGLYRILRCNPWGGSGHDPI